jgi:AraC-like DNA-binding protein
MIAYHGTTSKGTYFKVFGVEMNRIQERELVSLVDRFSNIEGESETVIPQVSLFRASNPMANLPSVYDPCLCIIAQGEKEVSIEHEVYRYAPSEYLAVAVDLPMMNRILKASKVKPYLLMKIQIDVQQLSELLIHIKAITLGDKKTSRGIFVGKVDDLMGDCILKLARMLETPDEVPILASQTIREIFYRVLKSEHGNAFAQISLHGSHTQRISSAIKIIRQDFRKPLNIEDLANHAGMSISSFHSHFKSVTAKSPLQFQKTLRLIEARRLMIAENLDSASAAFAVGYESASQFSREYSRMFGNPPGKDIGILKSSM